MHTPPTSFPPTNAGKSGAKPLLLKIKPEGERSDNKTREEISKMEPGSRRRYERNQVRREEGVAAPRSYGRLRLLPHE